MNRTVLLTIICVAMISSAGAVRARQTGDHSLSMADVMSAKEFEAAGLRKLTADEHRVINGWLNTYTRRVLALSQAASTSATEIAPTSGVIETRIEGEFNGWDGETIFRLQNGQIWQQSSYAYFYRYAYAPKVLIYKSGVSYKMKVDGVDREIAVKRLK